MNEENQMLNYNIIKDLLEKCKAKFNKLGIILKLNYNNEAVGFETNVLEDSFLEPFVIGKNKQPFYLEINSKNDVEAWQDKVMENFAGLVQNIDSFINTNSLGADQSAKLKKYKSNTIRCQKVLQANRKRINNRVGECIDVTEIQKVVGEKYSEIIGQKFIGDCLYTLYDGLRNEPRNEIYLWLLEKMNDCIEDLGISTIRINIGEVHDYELPFDVNEASREMITHDVTKKDTVKEIRSLAYVFAEPDGNREVYKGDVIIWRYEP